MILTNSAFTQPGAVVVKIGSFYHNSGSFKDPREPLPYYTLESQGLITTEEGPKRSGNIFWEKLYTVNLTEKGLAASKDWTKGQKGEGEESYVDPYIAPIARRELLEVTGMTDGGTVAEFTWKWVLSATGQYLAAGSFRSFLPGSDAQKGTAYFALFDDGYRLSRISLDGL